MGNRAVIAFEDSPNTGLYLHWEGGAGSVLAFLAEAKRRGLRGGDDYAPARLAQVIGEFLSYAEGGTPSSMAHGLSLGVGPLDSLDTDNGDNGTYWITPTWDIHRRENGRGPKRVETLSRYDRQAFDRISDFYREWEAHTSSFERLAEEK